MDNITLTLIQAGALVSTFTYVFSSGLRTRLSDLKYFNQRRGLLAWSLISAVVLMPLIAIAVIVLVQPTKATAIGLLLLASSPAAPTLLKKYRRPVGTGIMR